MQQLIIIIDIGIGPHKIYNFMRIKTNKNKTLSKRTLHINTLMLNLTQNTI